MNPLEVKSIWEILRMFKLYWAISIVTFGLVVYTIAEYLYMDKMKAAVLSFFASFVWSLILVIAGLLDVWYVSITGLVLIIALAIPS